MISQITLKPQSRPNVSPMCHFSGGNIYFFSEFIYNKSFYLSISII